jgi:hypothetical protein
MGETPGAATQWFKRLERSYETPIESLLGNRNSFNRARYRRAGQRCPTPAVIRADAPDPRAALESVVGPIVWFEIEEVIQAEPEVQPVNTPEVQIDPSPPVEADRVVPFRPPAPPSPPTPPEVLESFSRVLADASRLADLSMRLEFFRPPTAPAARRATHA